MFMASRALIWLVCLLAAGAIFVVDLTLPLGAVATAPYFAVILLAFLSPAKRDVLLLAAVCSALMIVGAVLSPPGDDPAALSYGIVNRVLSLSAVWITAAVAMVFRRSQDVLSDLNRELEKRVAQRTADAQQRTDELAAVNASLQREIDVRMRAQAELRESQAMYASLVEQLPIPIFRKDEEGRFTFVNQAFCDWVEVGAEQLLGKTDFDFFPPELAQKYRRDDEQVIRTGRLLEDVERNEVEEDDRYVHVFKTAVRGADGRCSGTQAIFFDITDRHRAEQALREQEALYHSLVDSLPLCLLRKDRDGKFMFVNQEFCRFFDVQRDDVLGKTDADYFPPDLVERYVESDQDVVQTGAVYSAVEEVELPRGGRRHIDVLKAPIRDAGGSIVGVQVIFHDVTEEIAKDQALKISEQRLTQIIDNSSAVVYLKDTEGAYQLVNAQFARLFKIEQARVVGKRDHELFPAEMAEAFRANDRRVLEHGSAIQFEEVAPHEDGPHTYVSIKFPLRRPDGEIYAVAGISTDITRRKQNELALHESQERLEATNKELEEFAYIASHDLQEPLRTLAFFSDSLKNSLGGTLSGDNRRDLDFITEASGRMQQLVQDLLSLSRAGRADMKRSPVQLTACVKAATTALAKRIAETHAQVEIEELPEVVGDKTLLTQLFQNLIGNAIKFNESDSPRVWVRAERGEAGWRVSVKDNGIGIKPEYARKIFTPFKRLHGRSKYEGTGIGLAICRKVVQRHDGQIWVDSTPGEGSHFQFEIPDDVNGDGA